jgi:hypothetical protein
LIIASPVVGRVAPVVPLLGLALSLFAGCGGAAAGDPGADASADGRTDGSAPSDAPRSDATLGTHDGVIANGAAPGRYLTNPRATGAGACAGKTLDDVIAAIHALEPSLADVVSIYAPAGGASGGSCIYAYVRADGGFDVVLKRGKGDCSAGCTDNEYFYFSTDEACQPEAVGHYREAWGVDSGSCLHVEGEPMWSHPPMADPLLVCGS